MIKKIIIAILFAISLQAPAQRWYRTWRWEFLFQSATPQTNGQETAVRFSGFFNYSHFTHFNPSRYWGIYWGLGIRNTGFSLYYDKLNIKETRRVYTLGFPVALKLGSMNKSRYLFAGCEIEFPFHYKQKQYQNEVKQAVYSEWMSNRTPWYLPSVFVGYQCGENLQLYVRYYCSSFINRDFVGNDFGDPVYYADFDNYRIMQFAICITGINRLTSKQKQDHRQQNEQTYTGL